jgi:hypothetical protein
MTTQLVTTPSDRWTRRFKPSGRYPCVHVEQKAVTTVFVHEIDHINYLTIIDVNNNVQVLQVTDVHPFWVVTDEPDSFVSFVVKFNHRGHKGFTKGTKRKMVIPSRF